MLRLGAPATLDGFIAARDAHHPVEVPPEVRDRLVQARCIVDAAMAGDMPVYGLNTALGAKLGTRIPADEIAAHQRSIIEGRACAVGAPLPRRTGRAMLLARLISAAAGRSGMSPQMFDHLVACANDGIDPQVPRWGSIGASDLTQNASWALAVIDADNAPPLQPKDGMALINHSALTVALAADALHTARVALRSVKHAALMSFSGYRANPAIFAPALNALRPAPGQAEAAAWFLDRLDGTTYPPTRVQDALSFRTLAPVLGAAEHALDAAIAVWEDEANGTPDSPAVVGDALVSTPNFHTPALALSLGNMTRAFCGVAQGSTERFARLLNPALSGLPRDLSPAGGATAGFVPLQKTAAALLSDIRAAAVPRHDPAPVSEGVEDMAPAAPQLAHDLQRAVTPLTLLAAIEARAAVQAHHLRPVETTGPGLLAVRDPLMDRFALRSTDTPLGPEVDAMAELLKALPG